MFSDRISHAVLIGTSPPGPTVKPAEQLFYDTAAILVNSFEDEVVLFFEPRSRASRAAAQRSIDRIAQHALNQQLPTVQLLTFPQAGHGPHHEHPQACAEHIATFVRTTG
jgi:hypothetical protein